MKLISLALSLCLSFNVLASTGTAQELEKALDNYNYSMAVEWDQKDVNFSEMKTQELIASVVALRNAGLSRDEMMNVIQKKVGDKAAFEALKLKVAMLNINSDAELAKAMRDISKDMYSQGASWSGSAGVAVGVAVVLVIAVVILSTTSDDYECVQWEVGEYCEAGDYMICGYGEHCVQYERKN
jgi:hypothetical protein